MKKYQKAKIVAKNLPTGSYSAGCGAVKPGFHWSCKDCERTL